MREKPFEGRLLVCDMDGTLLDSRSRVSVENKKALERFVEGGGLFTVATGRMEKMVAPYLADLPVNVPAIVYNGAAVYDFRADRMLWQCFLPDSAENVAKEILDRFPGAGMQLYYNSRIHVIRENNVTYSHMLREGFEPVYCGIHDVPLPWTKILIAWEQDRLTEVERYLKDYAGLYHYVYSDPQYIELLNIEASKGRALKELKSLSGIAFKSIVAVGDNMNDMEMLKEATVGIAVDNAHESLKACARMCCCSNDGHAVSEVIGWMEDGTI